MTTSSNKPPPAVVSAAQIIIHIQLNSASRATCAPMIVNVAVMRGQFVQELAIQAGVELEMNVLLSLKL